MRTFKVKTRWSKTDDRGAYIEEQTVLAEFYYNKRHALMFVLDDKNVASFPTRTTTVTEVKK